MFPSFIGILDIQSWWEVPSIAYFCSLFRTAFNLLDFDIEELEEALLTDGTEESASSLLTELIVRLLNGCLGNNDISAFNYQMFLRRLFRRKCQDTGRYNPFNTDIDFQFLPLRTKVEILYALCDFRLDAEDVFDLFKNLEAESLRVEPLGWDDNSSAYWYFYGTRLYREDIVKKSKVKNKKKKGKEGKKKKTLYGDEWLDGEETERIWQVVCFTEADWTHLTEKFKKATSPVEKELYRSLSENFLPEIPRLFQEKERLQRKRLLEHAPRRTSSRVLQKIKQKEEDLKQSEPETKDGDGSKEENEKDRLELSREFRARKRDQLRTRSQSPDSSEESQQSEVTMPQKGSTRQKRQEKKSKNSAASHKEEPPPEPPVKTGRKTNNSLACATGQIVFSDHEDNTSTRKKLKSSQIFSQSEEDIQTDMYKVLEQLKNHEDAWPFMDPVEEEYAPNYYAVIRRPMDLRKMEERLDSGYYTDFSMFKADFKLIVNNCRLYNGQDNEYTIMVDNLQTAFDRLTEKYINMSSSDEEIAVEYPVPTPSRKHKIKRSESPVNHKRKKTKSQSDKSGDGRDGSSSGIGRGRRTRHSRSPDVSKEKESQKESKTKKKHKGHHHHHHHNKHSKTHKKDEHKSTDRESKKTSKHTKKDKKIKEAKKGKQKHKRVKHVEKVVEDKLKRSTSQESLESSHRSRSASPLPSIHTPSPSPTPSRSPADQLPDPDFYKDKYDKIKERRRQAAKDNKDNWEMLVDLKQKGFDKQKQNLTIPERDKNQKLRETIEKLKAKHEKYKDTSIFNNLFAPATDKSSVNSDPPPDCGESSKDPEELDFTDDEGSQKEKKKGAQTKKSTKKTSVAKNESASEALEQAVKDISKWLDDAPKVTTSSSPSNSPALTVSTEEHENSRLDDEFAQTDKGQVAKQKEQSRKRPSSREPKVAAKRREIQRTIERLQPGKSKGNLLTNTTASQKSQDAEVTPLGPHNKTRDKSVFSNKSDEGSPKLSLGSVLPAVGFTLGNDHTFEDNEEKPSVENKPIEPVKDPAVEVVKEEASVKLPPKAEKTKEDEKAVTEKKEEVALPKVSQEKATPNLSAWFKAFGAPKSTPPTVKKKTEEPENEEKTVEKTQSENAAASPKNLTKYDSPTDAISPLQEGGDSPIPNITATPRQRRTSTGSSVSERSSFSQDLDSPRHQISHTSPLLRSPASPRTDDFQKITYPIINGTVRAGFYQDTTSIKSSPEKSCSPREGPQSPYSPYSPHVYASNSAGASAPNYFVDNNKSPVPTYGQSQPPPYYDSSKAPTVTKPSRGHDDYTALGPDTTFQPPPFSGGYSPAPQSPYSQRSQHSPYSQNSPHPNIPSPLPSAPVLESKNALFPVKKRSYNENEPVNIPKVESVPIKKDTPPTPPQKEDYQKIVQTIHSMSSLSTVTVDEIAQALCEKTLQSRTAKDKPKPIDFMNRPSQERADVPTFDDADDNSNDKDKMELENLTTGKCIEAKNPDGGVDMVNMGYFNPEAERRPSAEVTDIDHINPSKDLLKISTNMPAKPYDIEAIAINLGLSSQTSIKPVMNKAMMNKPEDKSITSSNAMSNAEKLHSDHLAQNVTDFSNPSINFSFNDLEAAAKKFYSNVTASNPPDYNSWKMSSQMRKQDPPVPANYAGYLQSSSDMNKVKSNINIPNPNLLNYNKTLQHQQPVNYGTTRPAMQRPSITQHNLPSELRIPNPRGMVKDNLPEASLIDSELSRPLDAATKGQKQEKSQIQNHPLVSSLSYKPPYSSHSSISMDSLRNIPNLPQMLERYSNEERYLQSFASSTSSLYHEKTLQMAQMFNKISEAHPVSSSASLYSQATLNQNKDMMAYKHVSNLQTAQLEVKNKNKRRRVVDSKPAQVTSSQSFHSHSADALSSVKSNMVPGSAFNFGPATTMGLGGGLYGDNSGFSMDTANQFLAANYMAAAAAAHQQRSNVESNVEKLVKPAHQNTAHTTSGSFPFIGHSQSRAAYPFVGTDTSSPLYQQYIMGLYPAGYPSSLGVRQPYDSINRPSWL